MIDYFKSFVYNFKRYIFSIITWNVTNMTMSTKVNDSLLLVIVVGDASVGKTNIIHCYSKGKVANNTMPTVGVEYASKIVPLRSTNG